MGSLALFAVLGAGLTKALLFRNLDYYESDLYSFLEMTWSWFYAGRFLHDNVYGYHAAIHNFYGLLAFAPLTIALGAYGLILGLVLAHAAAVLRVASCGALDHSGRLMVLAGSLGPFAFFVFDNPTWGFHPELLYPPLALLLAVELLYGWTWRSLAVAGAMVLVKEDGALVCAAIVLAHTVWRVAAVRRDSREETRRALRTGIVSLLVLAAVFLGGMAALALWSEHYRMTQETSSPRIAVALRRLTHVTSEHAPAEWSFRLQEALHFCGAMSLLMLLPLGKRLPKGLLFFMCALPPVVAILLVSSAKYHFDLMLWPPRIAIVQVAVVAALVFAAAIAPGGRPTPPGVVALLALLSWGAQVAVLRHLEYPLGARLGVLASVVRPAGLPVTPAEYDMLRCVASRLPGGLPVSVPEHTRPLFHRQSLVFKGREARAWHPARVRVVMADDGTTATAGAFCRGPAVGNLVVEAECDLLHLMTHCDPRLRRLRS